MKLNENVWDNRVTEYGQQARLKLTFLMVYMYMDLFFFNQDLPCALKRKSFYHAYQHTDQKHCK